MSKSIFGDIKPFIYGWNYRQGDILVPIQPDIFNIKYFIVLGARNLELSLHSSREEIYVGMSNVFSDDILSRKYAESYFLKIGCIPRNCSRIYDYFELFVTKDNES